MDDDIEVYSFEAMDISPAVDVHHISDAQLRMVVDEMKRFKDEMVRSLKTAHNEIKKFWIRKSQKPVLAVLLVQRPNEPAILYRGTNMEVSMPTGSLCAERNVIGTALAANPDMRREHLKMIAVLSVPPPNLEEVETPTVTGASASASTAAVIGSTEDPVGFSLPGMKRVASTASFGGSTMAGSFSDLALVDRKISIGSEADDSIGMAGTSSHQQSNFEIGFNSDTGPIQGSVPLGSSSSLRAASVRNTDDAAVPVRKIALYSSSHHASSNALSKLPAMIDTTESTKTKGQGKSPSKRRTLVVVQSNRDLNPLDPCGACNEWLKKIAECNPYFQVVTFTDVNCNGVYCRFLRP